MSKNKFCTECGNEISNKTNVCDSCGYDSKNQMIHKTELGNEIFLPHTVFYTNAGHKDDNPQWKESKYDLSILVKNNGVSSSDMVLIDGDRVIPNKQKPISYLTSRLEQRQGHKPAMITPEQAFMFSIKTRMFSMGNFIKAYYNKPSDEFVIDYPKGFCPQFIHLIGKRTQTNMHNSARLDEWLVLLSTCNSEINYRDLAYIQHSLLQFALTYGHYELSPNSPVIASFLEDKKPEGPATDWEQQDG